MKPVRVENFEGGENQFLIFTPEGLYFQSYGDLIAFKSNKYVNIQYEYSNFENIYLDTYMWDFYKPTKKYRNLFLGRLRTTDIERKIKEEKYRLIDLNNPTTKIKGGKNFEQIIKEIKKSNSWKRKFLGLKFK